MLNSLRIDKYTCVIEFYSLTGPAHERNLRACLHLLPKHPPKSYVRIEHGFKIDGQLLSEVVELNRPGSYSVDCVSEPENVFIKLSVPSQ